MYVRKNFAFLKTIALRFITFLDNYFHFLMIGNFCFQIPFGRDASLKSSEGIVNNRNVHIKRMKKKRSFFENQKRQYSFSL